MDIMDWKRGDILVDAYGHKVTFLEYTYNYANEYTFKGEDADGCIYDDFLVQKFREE